MSAKKYITITIEIVLIKLALIILINNYEGGFFGGGNDSNYYHAYAIGYTDNATSIWPKVLRFLNEAGAYDRDTVQIALLALGTFAIPLLVAKLSTANETPERSKVFWLSISVVSAYPTLFFFCFDIYRDIFMVFIFLIGAMLLKKTSDQPSWAGKTPWFLLAIPITMFLYLLRPYLGFGFAVALLLGGAFSIKKLSTKSLLLYFALALLALNAIFVTGALNPLIEYRSGFHELAQGGSNIGILLNSPVTFIPEVLLSTLTQMFGLHFTGTASLIVFLLESVPFTIAFVYLIRNRRHMDRFAECLVTFFIAYSLIWILANDNLGTAARLRMFSYLSIYIACMITYQHKKMHEHLAKLGALQPLLQKGRP